ncbi:hypothetical protein [Massilia sp. IC2-476]|uniref:hypothetical protein n=1 Tax=unclassified Massilia TaxID=2609279 RepID=UPI0035A354F6
MASALRGKRGSFMMINTTYTHKMAKASAAPVKLNNRWSIKRITARYKSDTEKAAIVTTATSAYEAGPKFFASCKSPPRNIIAIRKQTGNASKSAVTIMAILLVRLIDTIRTQSCLKRSAL